MANEKEISKRMNKLLTSDKTSNFMKKRMAAGDRGAFNLVKKRAAEAARATKVGKIAAGVAAAALATKAGLEKLYEKRTGKKPFTKREKKRTLVDKKMGGGLMKRKPIMASEGQMTPKGPNRKVNKDAISPEELKKRKRKSIDAMRPRDERAPPAGMGMRTGGICRGMGAALRGGDFKGVK
jgi:hypothetical protein